jgi:hypothetical protein
MQNQLRSEFAVVTIFSAAMRRSRQHVCRSKLFSSMAAWQITDGMHASADWRPFSSHYKKHALAHFFNSGAQQRTRRRTFKPGFESPVLYRVRFAAYDAAYDFVSLKKALLFRRDKHRCIRHCDSASVITARRC